MTKSLIIDIETFPNAFLTAGKVYETGEKFHSWYHEDGADWIVNLLNSGCNLVTFNGKKFDLPMLCAASTGRFSEAELKTISNALIEENMPSWIAQRKFGFGWKNVDHIDLRQVAPSFVGLKMYGARMHMPWLKELPFYHNDDLNVNQLQDVLEYCYNDLDTTEELFKRLLPALQLRVQMSKMYGLDMRSKSDTQMAEAAFVSRLGLKYDRPKIPATLKYKAPHFIKFQSPQLTELCQKIEEHDFEMNRVTGHVFMPEFLSKPIELFTGLYQMGVGGLHSQHDKKVCYIADKTFGVTDIDAASFYPSIIIACDLVPQNTGRKFLEEYKQIYVKRLAAKKSGDKVVADSLKISLNGTFGKTADKHSPLYSPDLMIAITLTGQLTLLVLIEQFYLAGFEVCSANTDGIAVRYPHADRPILEKIINDFSALSTFEFEYTPYRVLAMKDVNNYLAITPDRKVKAKGLYAPPDLRKNPAASICSRAVAEWLSTGKDFTLTVREGKLQEYLSARNVTGGGIQDNVYLGKTVRWYQTTDRSLPPLTYRKNGNKVPKTDGARALMYIADFDKHPDDLDYEWYARECVKIIRDLGCGQFLTEAQNALEPIKQRKTKK
jgi:DNA polymerase elongation subunit (family B)